MVQLLKDRNPVFDIAKAVMMLWVVWGHLGLYTVVEPTTSVYMLNAKIGINMPVFFVIGGCLAYSTFMTADWSKLIARFVMFVWPQFVVAAAYGSVIAMFGGNGAFSWVMGMWFLKTYAVIYILSAIVFRAVDTDKKRWLLFLVCYIAMLFWPIRFRMGCDNVPHMIPYFVFGLMCLRKKALYRDWKVGCVCGLLFFATVFLQGDSSANGMNFWKVNAHWEVVFSSLHQAVAFVARSAVGIIGSVFLLFLIGFLVDKINGLAKFSVLGTTSLGVYVLHEYPLLVLGRHCSMLPFPAWTRWAVACAVFLCFHFLVVIVKRNDCSRTLFFGAGGMIANTFGGLMHLGNKK